MHFEILIEDASGKKALDILVPKILGETHTHRCLPYKGIGRIPRNLRGKTDPKHRILLDQLPRILGGLGTTLQWQQAAVVVVVDLDQRNCIAFKQELLSLLDKCDPAPTTLFRIAIEEMEAWLLGDRKAIKQAYPKAKRNILDSYKQDSICGTWEILADAVYPNGLKALKQQQWRIGKAKCEWAENIAQHMNVDANQSPSFQVFRDGLRRLAETAKG